VGLRVNLDALPYRQIWCVDFEFAALPGERPDPECLVARELRSGAKIRLARSQFGPHPPYRTGPDSLFVAYFASAEMGCHAALGWKMPERILDLFTEFKNQFNGRRPKDGFGLLSALSTHGLPIPIGVAEKKEMTDFISRGGSDRWTDEEWGDVIDYCDGDTKALQDLLPVMLPYLMRGGQRTLGQALFRGRCMAAVARIEHAGVPIDTETLDRLLRNWGRIKLALIAEIDARYGVFEGVSFREHLFERYLQRTGTPWPRLESGRLDLEDDTFRSMARMYPHVSPLRELRRSLSAMDLFELTVGKDGRNRVLLSPFGAKTSRHTPSNSKFVFGASVWLRGLIKPPPGYALAYLDFAQQEFGTGAGLAPDLKMQGAYDSGDPYIGFGKTAGAIPNEMTNAEVRAHPKYNPVRNLFKQTVLGLQYGMGWQSLSHRIGVPGVKSRELIQLHREAFPDFWRYSDAAVDHALLYNSIPTVMGWTQHLDDHPQPRSLRNFPMQANGAEMLRLAYCLATERGVQVCAPIHDAILVVAPIDQIERDVAIAREAMREASGVILGGFYLTTDEPKIVRYPDRYMDEERGRAMWDTVMRLIDRVEAENGAVA
jgi:DNA polymerase I